MKKPFSSNTERLLYIETARQRVIYILFKHPDKEFSLSDLADEARVKKSNIGVVLDEFHKRGFIEITKLSNIWRIKANQKNWCFIRSKIVYNLNVIYESGLVEFLVDYFKNPKSVILFGSFRKGEDITGSDIDIAIEVDEAEEYRIIRLKELADFEKNFDRRVQLHLFNRKHVDINLFNNIANGVVLWGFLEVKP